MICQAVMNMNRTPRGTHKRATLPSFFVVLVVCLAMQVSWTPLASAATRRSGRSTAQRQPKAKRVSLRTRLARITRSRRFKDTRLFLKLTGQNMVSYTRGVGAGGGFDPRGSRLAFA